MSKQVLYIDNTNTITLTGLLNSVTGSYVNDATVTVTVNDSSGSSVSGETWPVTMDYVADSNGNYQASLDYGLSLTEWDKYTAVVTVTDGSSQAKFYEPIYAKKRS